MTPRLLCVADLAGAMRLKDAAGWNQTEQDWRNLMEIEPEGCFALDCDGVLAATATCVCYGSELAWIGMVLTAPEYRGRGLARRLMQCALEYAGRRRVAWIKLDATAMGRPLYLDLGFEDECAVERWHRAPAPAAPAAPAPGPIDFELDRAAFGADRASVLARAAVESVVVPGCGYALGRPGTRATYFGPAVARSREATRALLAGFVSRHAAEDVYWDLLPGNAAAAALAGEFGFERRRELMRMVRPGMARPPAFQHDDASVYAIAGFEYG